MFLLNEPTTVEHHKVRIKILTDNTKIYMGVITMAEFKKLAFKFDPVMATSNFISWISHDHKGSNFNSNSITSLNKDDLVDLSLKKGQLVVNKKKGKMFASSFVKDVGMDWYFFFALLGPGKVQIFDRSNKV